MLTSSRNQPFSKIPLQLALIGPYLALIVLAAGVVSYLSYRNGQQAVDEVARQLRAEVTQRIQTYVGAFLETPERINQLNDQAVRQGLLDLNKPSVLERYLWEQLQGFDSVSSIYVGNSNGGLIDAGREGAQGSPYIMATAGFNRGRLSKYATDHEGRRTTLLATLPDFDARTRPWYSSAVQQGGPTWSEVYLLSTGQDMAVAASRPVYDDRRHPVAVVSVDIFLSQLSHFLKSLPAGQTGQSFIVERSGLLIASSTDEKPFITPPGAEAPRRLLAIESAVPLIRGAAEALTRQFGDYQHITADPQLKFELAGQRQFLQVAPVHNTSGIDWLIVVVIPESDFMAQIEANNRTTVILIGLALLGAVILGVITAQGLTWPISRLAGSAEALARGEWPPIVRSTGWIGEINRLTQSFNKMAGQLQQTVTDLTAEIAERQRVEEELKRNTVELLFLNDLIELTTQPLSVADVQGHLVRFNHALEQLTGYSRDELQHLTYQQITPPSWHNIEAQYMAHLLATGQAVHYEKEYRRKDGRLVPVELVVELYRDEAGEPKYLYTFPTDITERKQAEAELLAERASLARRVEERTTELSRANAELTQALQTKDEFLGTMSHELRTPLAVVLGMAEILQEGIYGPLNEGQLKSAVTIEQSGRHLLALINDILDLAKVQAGKLELDLQLVSAAEICQASLLFIKEAAGKKSLELSFHLEEGDAVLQADPQRLKQILVSLLDNAVKFAPAGGQVSLEVRADPQQAIIHFAVQDSGIGIAAEDRAKLFKPFVQLDASLSRQYEGAGLGLALVRQFVELHGGTVGVESEGVPGLGSRFIVSLPWHGPR